MRLRVRASRGASPSSAYAHVWGCPATAFILAGVLAEAAAAAAAGEGGADEELHSWDAEQSTGMTLGSGLSFEEWYRAKNSGLGDPVSRLVDEKAAWRSDPQPHMPAERVRSVPDGMPAVIVKNVLSPLECATLMAGMPKEGGSGYMTASQVASLYRDRVVKARIMSNDTRLGEVLLERLRPHIPARLDGGRVLGLSSEFRFVHYDKGGHQACHVDGREPGEPRHDPARGGWVQSRLSVQVYLNSGHGVDFSGGGLSFLDVAGESKHDIVPDAGDVVIFYQERLHPPTEHPPVELHHSAHNVDSGEKFICRTMVDYIFPSEERARMGNLKDDAVGRPGNKRKGPLSVLAIGNTIIDNIMSLHKVPVDSKVFVNSKHQYVGGQASNAVRAMALLGLNVTFLTRLGDDNEGLMAEATYRSEGVDLSLNEHLSNTCRGAKTMSAVVVVETSTQQRTILMHKDEKLFRDASPAIEVAVDALRAGRFDVLYTDGHQLDLALPLAREAHRLGIPVIADTETLDEEVAAEAKELASVARDLIVPLPILLALSEKATPEEALRATLASRPNLEVLIATSGADGSYWMQRREALDDVPGSVEQLEFVHAAAFRATAVDTTGAGDTFHGGFVVGRYAHRRSVREAVDFATRVAAASTETPGSVVGREALLRYGIPLASRAGSEDAAR